MMQETIRRLLAELGEDPDREGLRQTPRRVAKAMRFLTSGYATDLDDIINGADQLGVDLDAHIAEVIEALKGNADVLGLKGTA